MADPKTGPTPDETGLIQKYLAPLAAPGGLGLVDDAACLQPLAGHDLILTMDTIVAGTHFLAEDDPFDIATKAITVNRSDLVAKGADVVGYLVAITFATRPTDQWMQAFCEGLGEQATGKLLGGDITSSTGPLTVTVTAIGQVKSGSMVKRSGASTGDKLFLSGNIGTSHCGLLCATNLGWVEKTGLPSEDIKILERAYSAPVLGDGELLSSIICIHASASLDVSDGLAIDLERLCDASGVGAQVDLFQVPLDPVVTELLNRELVTWSDLVTGGDDYVALFSVPQKQLAGLNSAIEDGSCFMIGEIVESEHGVTFNLGSGKGLSLGTRKGYDHFST